MTMLNYVLLALPQIKIFIICLLLEQRHVAQLQILRDAKIKQDRQWAEGQPCPSGWLHFNDSCYWGSSTPLSWFAAEHECRGFGYDAHLASVHSPDENTRVQALAGCGASWIGLTKMSPSQTSSPSAGWAWTDMSDNDFFYWRSGNPIGVDERNCAYQDKGTAAAGGNGWANGYCTELRVYTCKADAKINALPGGEGEGSSGGEGENKPGSETATGEGEKPTGEAGKATAPERLKEQQGSKKATTSKPKTTPKSTPKTTPKKVGKRQSEEPAPAEGGAAPNSESPFPCRGGAGWMDGKNGFCYFYSAAKGNWHESEARCREMSASILSVKDDIEQRIAMLGGCDRRTWLGAVKWQPEDKWHW